MDAALVEIHYPVHGTGIGGYWRVGCDEEDMMKNI